MRLTCPNCGARYEVADSMIPAEGRDVQCSNCTTTWFQPGRRNDGEQAAAETPPETSPETPPVMADQDDPAVAEADAAQPPQPQPPSAAPTRPEIDPAIRDILREEAMREARLRQAEAGLVESQPEMPLDAAAPAQPGRIMRTDLDEAVDAFDTDKAAAGHAVSARDLFPDIDQINSTLRDSGDRSADEPDASDVVTLEALPRRRRGARIGLLLGIALGALALALYVNADGIAARLPMLAGFSEGYVAVVNVLRFWLDDLAQSIGRAI